MASTSIEWATDVWNPTTGCDRVSPGCDHCYALTMAKRLKGMGSAKYQNDGDPKTSGPGFGITEHPAVLDQPLRWAKPRRIFVNSMSDLFHAGVSDDFIAQVFAVMALAPQHTFQLLTKRHARMRSLLNDYAFRAAVQRAALDMAGGRAPWLVEPWWPLRNVWLGVSVEDQHWADIRIPALLGTPAAVRWISAEPLLGPVDLRYVLLCKRCNGHHVFGTCAGLNHSALLAVQTANSRSMRCKPSLDWVVVGGESGAGARPMVPTWALSLRDQCEAAGVAFLFKQWGAHDERGRRVGKTAAGRELARRTHDGYPEPMAAAR